MKTEIINQSIVVTAVKFGRKFEPIPKRIEFGGRAINFVDEGIRIAISSGGRFTQILDMSDGHNLFRLRQNSEEPNWQLVSIRR